MLILSLTTAAAAADFLSFIHRVEHPVTAPFQNAQAIVSLTGGSGHRIRAGASLGEQLELPVFVSGVQPEIRSLKQFAKRHRLPAHSPKILNIELGKRATTTEENGLETAQWARQNGYKTLIVVTSSFHMERSLIELRRSMPEIIPLPAPVPTLLLNPGDWWKNSRTLSLITEEWITMRIAGLRALILPHKTL